MAFGSSRSKAPTSSQRFSVWLTIAEAHQNTVVPLLPGFERAQRKVWPKATEVSVCGKARPQ